MNKANHYVNPHESWNEIWKVSIHPTAVFAALVLHNATLS